MMSITASEARRRLFPLIEEVNDNAEAVEIVSRSGSAYLVPAAEYEAWRTTAHLFAAPANARHLIASYQEAMTGDAQVRELIDPAEEDAQ
jgi:antitoxin YefM